MAISTLGTTFCMALATLASATAIASVPAANSNQGPAETTGSPHFGAVPFDAGPATTAATLPGNDSATLTQLLHAETGALVSAPASQPVPTSEPPSLPLLGAAAIALLVAQLRRSRWPTL